jgi:hypothetical protein
LKDTNPLIVGIALVNALMLVTGTITVVQTTILNSAEAGQQGGSGKGGGNTANQGIGQSQRSSGGNTANQGIGQSQSSNQD